MRYKDLLEQTRTIRNLGEFNDQIKPYLSKINVFVFKGKQLITKIKSFSKTDVAKFCSLTLLYRTYNSTLNMLIYNYSKSLNDITIFNDEYSVKNIIKMKKEGKSSEKITEQLKNFKKNIEDSLNDLDNYLQTVKELDKKIDELLNE
jgi:predicted P-loop ATPase/GTPase